MHFRSPYFQGRQGEPVSAVLDLDLVISWAAQHHWLLNAFSAAHDSAMLILLLSNWAVSILSLLARVPWLIPEY